MIDGVGTGWRMGAQAAMYHSAAIGFTDEWIENMAFLVLQRMKTVGAAHLYPEERFIESFIESFKVTLQEKPPEILDESPTTVGK